MSALAAKLTAGSTLTAAERLALQEALDVLKAAWGAVSETHYNIPVSIAHVHLGSISVSASTATPVVEAIEDFLQGKIDAIGSAPAPA